MTRTVVIIVVVLLLFQEAELNNNGGNMRLRAGKGGARTGWPQHMWALELKQ